MVRYEFPSGHQDPEPKNGDSLPSGGNTPQKLPEFIYIDDIQAEPDKDEGKKDSREENLYTSINELEKTHYPWMLRILTFLAALLLLVAAPIILVIALCMGLFAIGCLGKVKMFNQQAIRYWKQFKKAVVIALGLLIATFSPAFGFATILLYFVLQGEEVNQTFLSQIMKNRNIYSPF